MDSADNLPLPKALLANAGFIRSVARELLADESRVEDVVQDTWISVLKNRPAAAQHVKAWLRRVVSNHAIDLIRSEGRRGEREQVTDRAVELPAPNEIVAREELRGFVVRALLALPESYRQVLVLQYYEGLGSAEIAKHLGLPLETVRTRARRGRERLRHELDRRYGKREVWSGLLAPWMLTPGSDSPAPGAGPLGAVAPLAAKLAAIALLALLGWLLHSRGWRPPEGTSPLERSSGTLAAHAQAEDGPAANPRKAPRVSIERRLRLKLEREGDQAPVAGARLWVGASEATASTGLSELDGTLRLDLPSSPTLHLHVDETSDTLEHDRVLEWQETSATDASPELELRIVLPRATRVHGRILDPFGQPTAGAELLAFPGLVAELGDQGAVAILARTTSDERGDFHLTGLPKTFTLLARTSEWLARDCLVAELEHGQELSAVELVVGPPERVEGRVLSSHGLALAGAELALTAPDPAGYGQAAGAPGASYRSAWRVRATSAADGSFQARIPAVGNATLRAACSGYQPVELPWSATEQVLRESYEVLLQESVAHDFRVRDASGRPIPGVRAQVLAESIGVVQVAGDEAGLVRLPNVGSGEELFVHLSADGYARSYLPPFRAGVGGAQREFRLEPQQRIEGRTLDPDGQPIAGARVAARLRRTAEDPWAAAAAARPVALSLACPVATSDALGRFHLDGLGPGSYEVGAAPAGGHLPEAMRTVEAGESEVVLVLGQASEHPATLRVDVRDALSLEPVDGFGFLLIGETTAGVSRFLEGGSAELSVPVHRTGQAEVVIRARGHALWRETIERFEARPYDLAVRLLPERGLDVLVLDAAGRPLSRGRIACGALSGAPCLIRNGRDLWLSEVTLRPNGEARLEGLPAQPLLLEVWTALRSEPTLFEVDPEPPEEGARILRLPWTDAGSTRLLAIELRAGDESAWTRLERWPEASAPRAEGTRATLWLRDRDERLLQQLEWRYEGGEWRPARSRTAMFERYGEEGLRELRSDRASSRLFATAGERVETPSSVGRAGLLLEVPREACRIRLQVGEHASSDYELPAAASPEERRLLLACTLSAEAAVPPPARGE